MDNDRLRAIEQKANTAGDDDVLFLLAIVARLRSEMGVMRDERDEAMAILRDIRQRVDWRRMVRRRRTIPAPYGHQSGGQVDARTNQRQ
jgi:hypothetical protein